MSSSPPNLSLLRALERTKIAVWRWSVTSNATEFFPPHVDELFGLPYDQVPQDDDTMLDLVHPDDRERVREAYHRTNVETGSYDIEYRVLLPSGRILHLFENCQPEYDEDGSFIGFFGLWQDITDMRQTEANLRESEQRLSLAVRIAELGYWVWDVIDDRLVWHSAEHARILGRSTDATSDEIFSSTADLMEIIHEEDRERYDQIVNAADRKGESYDIEFRILTQDGLVRYVREIGEPIFDAFGKHVRTQGTLQDISERQHLLETLRTRERELSQAQSIAKIGYWSLDPRKRQFTYWSEEIFRIFGVDSDSFEPTIENFHAAIHENDLEDSIRNRELALAESRPYKFEYRIVRPDGEIRNIAGEARPEFDSEGKPLRIFGVTQDVTETVQRDLALSQAQKMEAIGHLTGGIAHDFNNLLAVIQGNTELLIERSSEEVAPLKSVLKAARSGAALTQQLLAFGRRQPLDPQSCDLQVLVRGISDLLARTLGETIAIETVVDAGLRPVFADRSQLESALLNLAINARDAMPEGGKLTIHCRNHEVDGESDLSDAMEAAGDFVVIDVVDTGRGMSEEIRARAFDPFYTTKEVGEGSGLGLSMVYGFVKQSNGHVTLQSEPGMGSKCSIFLPSAATHPPEPTISNTVSQQDDPSERILIIEDNEDVREVVSSMVTYLGYQVVTAADVPAARQELARNGQVDLVLSDVILPNGLSGPDFADELAASFPMVKMLFMSGYPADVISRKGLLDSGSVWPRKPFNRQELADALRNLLET